ncbi:MAG: c-type cytochrome, partial [Candidatus Thiodiazotropha endolucinida]
DIQEADMVSLINERLADANYQGEAKDAAGYLLESMIEPGRYVVPTWGKKGTNDTESPMPAVDKASIELSSIEMDAIIAYLQAKDGNEVTVSLPSPEEAESVAGAEAIASGSAALPTPAATAEEALGKFACSSCHALDSADTLVGPGLVDIGARLSKEEIRQSIIDPNAVIAEGFPAAMPADLAEKMTVKELELLVTYLAEKK